MIDMEIFSDFLRIENEKVVCEKIEKFIKEKVEELKRNGVILGLSGGVDSALVAYLCVRALGADKVFALYMPEKDSKKSHFQDAKKIADLLKIDLRIFDLTSLLERMGIYRLYPMSLLKVVPSRKIKGFITEKSKELFGKLNNCDPIIESRSGTDKKFILGGSAYVNIKHRLRMAVLHFYADLKNLATVGAANQTEFLTGVFVKFGIDGVADFMPILPLFKVQVRQLAYYIGIPREIVKKTADPDIVPGFNNKGKMFKNEALLDLILIFWKKGFSVKETTKSLMNQGITEEFVERIYKLVEISRNMREVPYIPDI